MSILVVGTVAFDAIETPFGKTDKIVGGAATYICLSSSFFTKKLNLVSVVGEDGSRIIPFANIFVQGPLTGGLIILTLNLSRYNQADISDIFLGFKNYGWLLLVTLVQGAVVVAAIVPGVIVMLLGGLLP